MVTEHEATNRVLCINWNGQVLGVSMDEQTIIPYILAMLNNMELAFKLKVAVTCLVTLLLPHPSSCCHHLAPCHFVNTMAFITLSSSPPQCLCVFNRRGCYCSTWRLLGQHIPPYTRSAELRKPNCSPVLFVG